MLPARHRGRGRRTRNTVAIVGLGPIGLMLCACVADAGGRPVGVGSRPERRALATSFGAVSAEPEGADVVVEAAGTVEAWGRPLARPSRRHGTRVRRPAPGCARRAGPLPDPLRGGSAPRRVPTHPGISALRSPSSQAARSPSSDWSRTRSGSRALPTCSTTHRATTSRRRYCRDPFGAQAQPRAPRAPAPARALRTPLGRALQQVAGLQAQYAPSPYIRLWSMLEGFQLGDLTRALERRRAVQGTLMRSTIHVVSARDYWRFAAGIGPSRREVVAPGRGASTAAADVDFAAARLEPDARRDGAWHRKEARRAPPGEELDRLVGHVRPARPRAAVGDVGASPRRPLPPRGRVGRARGRDRGRRARAPPPPVPRRVRAPSRWPTPRTGRASPTSLRADRRAAPAANAQRRGRQPLLDLPRAPLPAEDTPAPVRFLGT